MDSFTSWVTRVAQIESEEMFISLPITEVQVSLILIFPLYSQAFRFR